MRVAAALREDAEAHIVDARIVQPFTRESFDLFVPPSPSFWSRLGSIVSAGDSHRGMYLKSLVRRALIILGVWHLIGVLSLASVSIAMSSVSWTQKDSLTPRLFASQYGL